MPNPFLFFAIRLFSFLNVGNGFHLPLAIGSKQTAVTKTASNLLNGNLDSIQLFAVKEENNDISSGQGILSVNDEWILEELVDKSVHICSRRNDVSNFFWLLQGSGPDQELTVQHEDELSNSVIVEKSKGVFRLSRLLPQKHKDTVDTTKDDNQLQTLQESVGDVGTKLLWEDSCIKIWEFRLAPDQCCDFHRHLHPYFFLNLSESLTQELDCHAEAVVGSPPNLQTRGQCTYVSHEHLSAHGVRNVGDNTFLQFVVEFVDES